jgi:hypothetical protein
MIKVFEVPAQLSELAFTKTVMVAEMALPPSFLAIKAGIIPLPLAGRPMAVLLFVQLKLVPGEGLVKGMPALAKVPLQKVVSAMGLITGVGLTVSLTVSFVTQPVPVDKVKI